MSSKSTRDRLVTEARERISDLNAEKAPYLELLEKLHGEYILECPQCHEGTQKVNLVKHSPYWYESPWGCTGGAEWWPSDDTHIIQCPKCSSWSQAHSNTLSHVPEGKGMYPSSGGGYHIENEKTVAVHRAHWKLEDE